MFFDGLLTFRCGEIASGWDKNYVSKNPIDDSNSSVKFRISSDFSFRCVYKIVVFDTNFESIFECNDAAPETHSAFRGRLVSPLVPVVLKVFR